MKIITILFISYMSVISVFAEKPENPGSHKNIACDDVKKYTFNVYIPKSYGGTDSEKRFPVLYISSPGGRPNFMKLESWAEKNNFLLITVNDSKNGISWDLIKKMQNNVIKSTEYLRKHHCLQFATGFSGSAWASVIMANNHPDKIAGVFMNCHSGNGAYVLDKSKSMALVSGKGDTIHGPQHVKAAYERYKKKGFHTTYKMLDMGHKWAPKNEFIKMLNFMYSYQRFANIYLTADEQKEAYSSLEKVELPKIIAMSNKKGAVEKLSSFMALTKLMKSPTGVKIYQEWGNALLAYAKAEQESNPVEAYFYLNDPLKSALYKKVPSAVRNELVQIVRNISRNKLVQKEINADKRFQSYQRKIARTRNARAAKSVIKSLEKYLEEYPGTKGAGKAQKAIIDLKKLK